MCRRSRNIDPPDDEDQLYEKPGGGDPADWELPTKGKGRDEDDEC
jgi:hypothetical protein